MQNDDIPTTPHTAEFPAAAKPPVAAGGLLADAPAVAPDPDLSDLDFLTLDDALLLRRGLRGVQIVDVRQVGDHPSAGPEVVAFLQAEGLEASYRQIERMVPPPLRRFVFRYSGNRAELTIAPLAAG